MIHIAARNFQPHQLLVCLASLNKVETGSWMFPCRYYLRNLQRNCKFVDKPPKRIRAFDWYQNHRPWMTLGVRLAAVLIFHKKT